MIRRNMKGKLTKENLKKRKKKTIIKRKKKKKKPFRSIRNKRHETIKYRNNTYQRDYKEHHTKYKNSKKEYCKEEK